MCAASTSRFSTGLQFSRKDLQSENTNDSVGGHAAGIEIPLLSEEEHLARKATALRRSIAETLQPRLDVVDDALRSVHRQLSVLRQCLPSHAFIAFRENCDVLRRQLQLFEELTVQRLLKEAAEKAVAIGACEASHVARWKKSNQWPAVSNFVELQLYLSLKPVRLSPSAMEMAGTNNAAAATTSAIQKQLAILWCEWQDSFQRHSFLCRFYSLKDVLYGWGRGWRMGPPCTGEDDSSRADRRSRGSEAANSSAVTARCLWEKWESLSANDRLMSFAYLCSLHLTEPIVSTLEQALVTEFADVWSVVTATL
ncbi:hypothetical protein ABB37_03865 [Leptomonas pyrrhocoris]|uniref:Uncharacterized protein n=1 Tax=Leptomonas pyrrhocoris TaxID=157538 RepID=A0A0N0DWA6_LEPPY|nr:hypothetical protein ABB37_03865 [Leptomonas pyrrhocoris]KPA81514.1 hypothetical protein ABB37_03865 [Leptomonas pyrrhocoris]|eukprot:XP_015659953.1 hypothetical protein ABB37_03865 [Leptomonas pyrrhocoris]